MRTTKKSQTLEPLVVGVAAACTMLDTSKDGLYKLLHSGELESYLDGSQRRITTASIRQLIQRKVGASQEFKRAPYPNRASRL